MSRDGEQSREVQCPASLTEDESKSIALRRISRWLAGSYPRSPDGSSRPSFAAHRLCTIGRFACGTLVPHGFSPRRAWTSRAFAGYTAHRVISMLTRFFFCTRDSGGSSSRTTCIRRLAVVLVVHPSETIF